MNESNMLRSRFLILAVGIAVGLTLIWTWPLGVLLTTHVPGRSVDAEQFMWSYWWFKEALTVRGISPFYTDMLYYPEGTSLRYQTTNTFHAILSIPLQYLVGIVPTFNLIGLAIFVASFLGMVWLAYDISQSRIGALVAGLTFAFAPITLFHWRVGQYNMLSVEFLPVYIAALRRALLAQSHKCMRWVLVAAVALVCAALCDWQFAVYLGVFSPLMVAATIISAPSTWRSKLLRASAIAGIAFVALLPMVLPMIGELQSDNPYMLRKERDTIYHSADVAQFLVPNPASPFWGDYAERQLQQYVSPGILATVVSLSFVATVFALIGTLAHWRIARFWLCIGALFWLFALGPRLKWFGRETDIALPYLWLFQFKIVQISRFPARFFLITEICLAVLAALGMAWLLNTKVLPRLLRTCLVVVGAFALAIELLPAPRYAETLSPAPSFYTDGTLTDAGGIIEQPNPSNRGMYFQLLHNRPVVWGELSRDNPTTPVLRLLRAGPSRDQNEIFDNIGNWNCVAAAFHLSYWVHYTQPGALAPPPDAKLVREEPLGALYQLTNPGAEATCLWLDTNWQSPRRFDDGTSYRWIPQDARLGLLRQKAGRVRVSMQTHCFAGPRTIEISLNNAFVTRQENCGWPPTMFTFDLDLPEGWSWLTLHSVQPAARPSDFGYPETEPIAIGVSKLSTQALR